jgi:ubiquinone/menaquinone biosynthesis C-methylase UbiE
MQCSPVLIEGEKMQETGYETFSFYYDALTENVSYPERAEYFDRLIQKHLRSGGNVMLDLACGTGTMTEEMAKRGYDMIGVDYSAGMLSQAMEKKFAQGLDIQYVQQDMRNLELYGTVDVTLCTLDSLNHLPDFSAVTEVFRRVAEATEPGGLFLFDMNTLYKHRELLGNQIYLYETEEVYCVWENALQPDGCTVEITLQLFQLCQDGRYRRQEEQITERAYAPEQVQEALENLGFSVIGIYHADTETPLTPESQRMVVVARKD